MLLLDVNNIHAVYGDDILVLKGLSFRVSEGDITVVVGANGAGKSTTLKTISGLLRSENGRVSKGYVQFNGTMIHRMNAADIVRLGIFLVMEGRRVFQDLTVEENLAAASYTVNGRSAVRRRLDMVKEYFPILRERKRQLAGYLSGGERQMLAIASALVIRPRLLLLDEPSAGLAPMMAHEIFNIVSRLNQEERVTVLLVEQHLEMALSIAHYGYVMENGRVVLRDVAQRLKENHAVKDFYLGPSSDVAMEQSCTASTAGDMSSASNLSPLSPTCPAVTALNPLSGKTSHE